jgi:hypothetical protein
MLSAVCCPQSAFIPHSLTVIPQQGGKPGLCRLSLCLSRLQVILAIRKADVQSLTRHCLQSQARGAHHPADRLENLSYPSRSTIHRPFRRLSSTATAHLHDPSRHLENSVQQSFSDRWTEQAKPRHEQVDGRLFYFKVRR